MEWCRYHQGISRDPKWRAVARRVGARPADVFAVWGWLMDDANQQEGDARGSVGRFNADEFAAFYDVEEDLVLAIVAEFGRRGMIAGDRLAAWERRNPQREDPGSTERSRSYRDRQRAAAPLAKAGGSANDGWGCNAVQRGATQRNAPEGESEKRPPLTPPLPMQMVAKDEGGDPPRAAARASAFGAPKAFTAKEKRDAWLGNAIREAARLMPDKVGDLTAALLEDQPPRWANEAAARLNTLRRQRLAAERRGTAREPRRGIIPEALPLPIAGKMAA
jgi:hypothetical protein